MDLKREQVNLVAGADIADSMTLTLGHAIKYAYKNGIELDISVLKSLFIFKMKESVHS